MITDSKAMVLIERMGWDGVAPVSLDRWRTRSHLLNVSGTVDHFRLSFGRGMEGEVQHVCVQ